MWILIILLIPRILARDMNILELENTTAPEQEEVRCPSNMVFDISTKECECKWNTVYYPPKDNCFNPFEQGPCAPGHHLAISKNTEAAECIINTYGVKMRIFKVPTITSTTCSPGIRSSATGQCIEEV